MTTIDKYLKRIIMNFLKTAKENLKYVLMSNGTDISTLILGLGSLLWSVWALIMIISISFFSGVNTTLHASAIGFWGLLFFIHGVWSTINVIYNIEEIISVIANAALGAILWTSSSIIIIVARISDNSLPMGSAHYIPVFLAWWIVWRNVFNKRLY